MAAVQFKGGKCHGRAEARAMIQHACADERIRHDHANADLNKALTCHNTDLHRLTYQQMLDAYDARIERYRAASAKALRKDAVTLLDLIITKPAQLPADKEDAWYRDVEAVINRHYGAEVVLDIKIHRDEIHDYTNVDTGERVTSRAHGHAFVYPEVDGRLCAKSFSSRRHMRELNREIDAMTNERYHCAFLTGTHSRDRGFQSVEQLKCRAAEMERAADAMRLISKLDQERQTLEQDVERLRRHPDVQAARYYDTIKGLQLQRRLAPYMRLYDIEQGRLDVSVDDYEHLAKRLRYEAKQDVLDRLGDLEQAWDDREDDDWER